MKDQYYRLVVGSRYDLEDKVNQLMKAGYELVGAPFIAVPADYHGMLEVEKDHYTTIPSVRPANIHVPCYAQAMIFKNGD